MQKIKIIWIIVLTSCSLCLQSQEVKFTQGTFEEILQQAQRLGKPIFFDCYTSWCGPCKMMEKEVFTDPRVANLLNNQFINVKMDMEKGEGKELSKKFQVKAYPTFILFNSNGEEMHRIVGGYNSTDFLNKIENALGEKSLYKLKKQYDLGNRDDELIRNYIQALGDAYQPKEARELFLDYWKQLSSLQRCDTINWPLIKRFVNQYDSEPYQFLLNNKKAFIKNIGQEKVDNKLSISLNATVINGCNDIMYKRKKGDVKQLNFLKKSIKKANIAKGRYLITTIDYTLAGMKGDVKEILKMYQNSFDQFSNDEKMTATLQLNAMLYGSDNVEAKKQALQLVYERMKACGWTKENPMIGSVLETLQD